MKKIVLVLVFLLSLFGCSAYKTKLFVIDNDSDWNIVVSIKNCYETGKKRKHLNYMIPKRSSYTLNLYINGECELISVNGAKIIKKNNSELILKNDTPKKIRVINSTDNNILLSNTPSLPCPLNSYYVEYYTPLFSNTTIGRVHNAQLSAKEIDIYAWQLEISKTEDELNNLSIGIKNTGHFKYKFKKIDNHIYLLLF